eukprot:8775246-Heterocapsa_arctica.AAC.1
MSQCWICLRGIDGGRTPPRSCPPRSAPCPVPGIGRSTGLMIVLTRPFPPSLGHWAMMRRRPRPEGRVPSRW